VTGACAGTTRQRDVSRTSGSDGEAVNTAQRTRHTGRGCGDGATMVVTARNIEHFTPESVMFIASDEIPFNAVVYYTG